MFHYIACAKRPKLFNRMSVLLLTGWISLIGMLAVTSEALSPELSIQSVYLETLFQMTNFQMTSFQMTSSGIGCYLATSYTGTVL